MAIFDPRIFDGENSHIFDVPRYAGGFEIAKRGETAGERRRRIKKERALLGIEGLEEQKEQKLEQVEEIEVSIKATNNNKEIQRLKSELIQTRKKIDELTTLIFLQKQEEEMEEAVLMYLM